MAAKNPTLDSLRAAPGRKKLSVIEGGQSKKKPRDEQKWLN